MTFVLRLNGIPTPVEEGISGIGFVYDPQGYWRSLQDDHSDAVDTECAKIHDLLASKLFGDIGRYYDIIPFVPQLVSAAGLGSEAAVTRDLFVQWLQNFPDQTPDLNRLLYLYDCRLIVSSIQECTKEISILTGEFYRILNLEPFFPDFRPEGDGIRYTSSPIVTRLTSAIGFIYIRLYSLLDYTTKLAYEAEHLATDFTAYPKLASINILFGDRKRLNVNALEDSLFQSCDQIHEIETVRNRLIHDGMLDDIPKAYEVWTSGAVTERFLLMPDRTGKSFDRFKGRRLFYGREDKVNLRLQSFVQAFNNRQLITLGAIQAALTPRDYR